MYDVERDIDAKPLARGNGRGRSWHRYRGRRSSAAAKTPEEKEQHQTRKLNYPVLLSELRLKALAIKPEQWQLLKKAIRAQCRTIRNVKKPPLQSELDQAHDLDPWCQRLPGMHRFLNAHMESFERRVLRKVQGLIQQPQDLLKYLDSQLTAIPSHSHVTNVPLLRALVKSLADPVVFVKFLDAALAKDSWLDAMADQSYHQDPKGLFDKIVLASGPDWKLRLHIFEEDKFFRAQEEIHSHRDHFVSVTMQGGIDHIIWEDQDLGTDQLKGSNSSNRNGENTPESPENAQVGQVDQAESRTCFKYEYDPTTQDGAAVFRVRELGRVQLQPVHAASTSQGDAYYMHPSVLHSVESVKARTMTLVLNRRACAKSCFAAPDAWPDQYVRVKMSKDVLKLKLKYAQHLALEQATADDHTETRLQEAKRA